MESIKPNENLSPYDIGYEYGENTCRKFLRESKDSLRRTLTNFVIEAIIRAYDVFDFNLPEKDERLLCSGVSRGFLNTFYDEGEFATIYDDLKGVKDEELSNR